MTGLHQIGQWLRELLQSVPLSVVRGLFLGSLVILLIWVLRLPASVTAPREGARRWDENLKVGAVIAILIQIAIYSFL